MKKDLLVVGSLLVVAALGIGGVFWWQTMQPEDDGSKTIKPKTEPIAMLVKKAEPRKPAAPAKKETGKPPPVIQEKKPAPVAKKIEPAPPAKKIEVKIEPKKEEKKRPTTKLIVLDNLMKINDPDGEFTAATVNGGQTIILIGIVKTLKIAAVNERSVLDATGLEAQEIILIGTINGGSTVKLHAPGGSVVFLGEINDRANVDVLAKDVDLRGAVNGTQTQLKIMLTKDGSLKFRRLNGGVSLHYQKADASDPEPRIDAGEIDARAELRKLPAGRK